MTEVTTAPLVRGDDFRVFEALGCHVHVATSDPGALEAALLIARAILSEVDETCSRFRADSDLSRVNAGAGSWVAADPLLVAATRVALDAAEDTAGLVDPCLGARLVSLGYDADLGTVRRRPDLPSGSAQPHPVGAWQDVRVETEAIRVPRGVALDLGATAKAWSADLVALTVADTLGGGAAVSVGGDVRVVADGDVPAWPVFVTEHPDGASGTTVWIDEGGLATSSTVVRRWRAGGVERHHLLDPRTGMPTDGPWRTVSATGHTCVAANIATTASLVIGEDAPAWLADRGVDARLVDQEGRVVLTGSWPTEGR